MFETIVWATDGSESADRALPYATAIARENSASLLVVHCVEFFAGPRSGREAVLADEDELQAKIRRQVAEMTADGVDAKVEIISGSTLEGAAHLIADAAREAGADLLIVGTRGHTPLAGLLLGSVTERLLHLGPCPVLAIPATMTEASAEGPESAVASA
jgi:nucleotide-binding universal stress UspA family protein